MSEKPDLVGQSFGCLTVIEKGDDYIWRGGECREPRWLCRCACGREAQYRQSRLKRRPPWHCANCQPFRTLPEKCQWCSSTRAYVDPPACRRCYVRSRRNGHCRHCDRPRLFNTDCVCQQGIDTPRKPQSVVEID